MPALTIEIGGVPASIASSALSRRSGAAAGSPASGRLPASVRCGGKRAAGTKPYWAGIWLAIVVTAAHAGIGAQEDAVAEVVVARGRDHRTTRARRTRTSTGPPSESTLMSQSAGRAVERPG